MLKRALTAIEGWHEWSIIDKKKLYYSPSYSVWKHYKSLDVLATKKNWNLLRSLPQKWEQEQAVHVKWSSTSFGHHIIDDFIRIKSATKKVFSELDHGEAKESTAFLKSKSFLN